MNYELRFSKSARKEWSALEKTVQARFKAKLATILNEPEIPAYRLPGKVGFYKLKLKGTGHRLVYDVNQACVSVDVLLVTRKKPNDYYSDLIQKVLNV